MSRVSLPRCAAAEPCDGEQLPALLSRLENVRCDTAAAAKGQADKEWAREGLERGEGMPANPFLSSPRARGLGKSCVTLGAQSCLPFPAACPPPAPCPESSHIPRGLRAFPSSVERHSEWLGALFAPRQSCQQQGLSESIPQGHWGCIWAAWVGTESLLCCCRPDPAWPQGHGPCLGVPVTTCRAGEQGSVKPGRGFAASRLFGWCTTWVGLQRAPSCLPSNLWGQV